MAELKLVRNQVEGAVAADYRTNWKSLAQICRKHNVSMEFAKELQKRYDPHEKNRNIVKIPKETRLKETAVSEPTSRFLQRGVAGVGLLLGGVGVALNYQFAQSLGQTTLASYLLGTLGVAIDVATIFLPSVSFIMLEKCRYGQMLIASSIWLLCLGLSLIAGLSFASSNIGDSLQIRESVVQHRTTLNAQLSYLQMARGRITDDSDPRALEEQIQIERGRIPLENLRSSEDCSKVSRSGPVCAELNKLRATQRIAEQRNGLDRDIQKVTEQIAALPPISVKDPGAEHLSRVVLWISGIVISPAGIEMFRAAGYALLPIFGGIFLAFARTLGRA